MDVYMLASICIEVDGSTYNGCCCLINTTAPIPSHGITAVVQKPCKAERVSSHLTLAPCGRQNRPGRLIRGLDGELHPTTECPSLAAPAGGCCSSPGLHRTVLHRLVTVPHDSKKSRKKKVPRAAHRRRGGYLNASLHS